jgi:hypothetical protein
LDARRQRSRQASGTCTDHERRIFHNRLSATHHRTAANVSSRPIVVLA